MSQEKAENPFVKMKSKLKAMNSRMNNEQRRAISDLEDRIMEIIQSEQQEESQMKKEKENNIRGIWDKIKHDNLGII